MKIRGVMLKGAQEGIVMHQLHAGTKPRVDNHREAADSSKVHGHPGIPSKLSCSYSMLNNQLVHRALRDCFARV